MKLQIRRVGNSLGIILPKATLDDWGLGEGDHLELSARSVRPPARAHLTQEMLDEHKRKLAVAVVSMFTSNLIRAHSLANLRRWQRNDVWGSAYDEWQRLMTQCSDGELFAVMLGRDEHANQLRQSPPYVGLLPRDVVRRLNEETAG